MRPQDWAFFAALAAGLSTVAITINGGRLASVAGVGVTVVLAGSSRLLSRRYHGPMPAFFWWGLLWPRNLLGPGPLTRLLAPRPGERIFELGPGIGVHALPLAATLLPGGVLHVLDIQQAMLDHLTRRARRAGVTNIETTALDGQRLPYASSTFDGAYLIDELGEMPDARATLRDLRRILKPDGRLVVGEHFVDPDFVSLRSLESQARDAGFTLETRRGIRLLYLARFRATSPGPDAILPSPA
jgi:SAM-dependent methyltransferase